MKIPTLDELKGELSRQDLERLVDALSPGSDFARERAARILRSMFERGAEAGRRLTLKRVREALVLKEKK